jgi:ribonuclease BN (tRNA processing enzyme)
MRIRILGCYGNELPGYRTVSFLVNDSVLIDAGSVTSVLTLEEQMKLKTILVSHSHLDHIKDLAFLADNVIGGIKEPISIVSTRKVIDDIRKNLLNNVIWPDFTVIPSKKSPVFEYKPIGLNKKVKLNGLEVKAVEVDHSIHAIGYLISDGKSSMLYSGDTGPTKKLWQEVSKHKNIKAMFIEISFPNVLQGLADVSGHFTPKSLSEELKKLADSSVPIYLYHLKPKFLEPVLAEIKALGRNNLHILTQGQTIVI